MSRMTSPKVIMITGAAGYVGAMLCHQFSKSPDLEKIIAVDVRTMPALLKDNKKIIWITANLADNIWKIPAMINKPEVVIHSAWSDNEPDVSRAVFEFCFKNDFVKKVIFFGSATCYGAFLENDPEKFFSEQDELREDELPYGLQKISAEQELRNFYDQNGKNKQIIVLRPSIITGPRGRSLAEESKFIFKGTEHGKQYIHEDDVTDAVAMFTFGGGKFGKGYEVFNLSPNDLVSIDESGKILDKTVIKLPPAIIKFIFFIGWHLSGGKMKMSAGEWRFASYPVPVDGSLISKKYSFEYLYNSRTALEGAEGRYAK